MEQGRVKTRILQLMAEKQSRDGRIISPSVVADESEVSRQTIYNWINGDLRRFEESVVVKLCRYFDCKLGDLLYVDLDAG